MNACMKKCTSVAWIRRRNNSDDIYFSYKNQIFQILMFTSLFAGGLQFSHLGSPEPSCHEINIYIYIRWNISPVLQTEETRVIKEGRSRLTAWNTSRSTASERDRTHGPSSLSSILPDLSQPEFSGLDILYPYYLFSLFLWSKNIVHMSFPTGWGSFM